MSIAPVFNPPPAIVISEKQDLNVEEQTRRAVDFLIFGKESKQGYSSPLSAIAALEEAADAGYSYAQIQLGLCYMRGHHVEKDYAQAEFYLNKH